MTNKHKQREKKKHDKNNIKHLPTEYINFDSKKIKERKVLVEESRKQNKLEIVEEEDQDLRVKK